MNEWISVKERLPEKYEDVLMLFGGGDMTVGSWKDRDEHATYWVVNIDDGFCGSCDAEPVHWMLLPEPPKEDDHD